MPAQLNSRPEIRVYEVAARVWVTGKPAVIGLNAC